MLLEYDFIIDGTNPPFVVGYSILLIDNQITSINKGE
jgi:hypothetical protein